MAVRQLLKIEKGLFCMPVYEYFCYVTTEQLSPMEAHCSYGKRATCETWIEECKSQMKAGHLRTSEFLANAALFQCAVLAYNLLKWMALLTGGVIRQWEVKTMRLWLIRVAGKLTKGSRPRSAGQAVDIKVTRKISSSGRMACVGVHDAECRVLIKSDFCLLLLSNLDAENTAKRGGTSAFWFLLFWVVRSMLFFSNY